MNTNRVPVINIFEDSESFLHKNDITVIIWLFTDNFLYIAPKCISMEVFRGLSWIKILWNLGFPRDALDMHHCGPRTQNLQVPEGQSVFKRHFVLFRGDVNATSSVSTCAFAQRNLLSVVSNWVILMQVRLRHRRWVPRLFKARNISLLDSRSDQRQITLGSFICSLHGSCLSKIV